MFLPSTRPSFPSFHFSLVPNRWQRSLLSCTTTMFNTEFLFDGYSSLAYARLPSGTRMILLLMKTQQSKKSSHISFRFRFFFLNFNFLPGLQSLFCNSTNEQLLEMCRNTAKDESLFADVCDYGTFLIELISGRSANDFKQQGDGQSLSDWVRFSDHYQ